MKPDQIVRLKELQDKLVDIYLDEADPGNWPESRGDRVWHKKDANLTITHVIRIETLLNLKPGQGGLGTSDEQNDEAEALTAEATAQAEAIIAKAKGTRFGPRAK